MSFVLSEFRLAVVQLQVTSVKADNLSRARRLVKEAAGQGSKVVLLPVRIVTGEAPVVTLLQPYRGRRNMVCLDVSRACVNAES